MSGPVLESPSVRPPVVEPPAGLRVRPPVPLSPRRRLVLAVVGAVAVVVGGVLVMSARSSDGATHPGASWDGHVLPPRGATIDAFDVDGPLGQEGGPAGGEDGMRWSGATAFTKTGGALVASGSVTASSTEAGSFDDAVVGAAASTTWIDTGGTDVLVYAQVIDAPPGTRLVISHERPGASGAAGVWLAAVGDGRWKLLRGPARRPIEVATFDAPTSNVAVEVVRRGKVVKVQFDQRSFQAAVVDAKPDERWAGIGAPVEAGTTARFDLFGYLPLPAG